MMAFYVFTSMLLCLRQGNVCLRQIHMSNLKTKANLIRISLIGSELSVAIHRQVWEFVVVFSTLFPHFDFMCTRLEIQVRETKME